MAKDVASVQRSMESYVAQYEARVNTALSVYQTKVAASQACVSDRAKYKQACQEEEAAKAAYESALQDYNNAKTYADQEIAKARSEASASEKDGDKKSDSTAKIVGLGVAGVTAGAAVKGVKSLGNVASTSRLMVNNTASTVSMAFAKYFLGWDGDHLPRDPTRKTWDPSLTQMRKNGLSRDPEAQPSFI